MDKLSAHVAVCCNQPTIFRKTAQSLMELGWGDRIPYAKEKAGFDSVTFAWYTASPRVDLLRNHAVMDAIKHEQTHLIFLDADMVWPTDVIHRLLQHKDHGIVGGMYMLKGPPYAPVHLVDRQVDEHGISRFHRAKQDDFEYGTELIPVDVVGMGCTIIPISACKAIGDANWFEYQNDEDDLPRVSEDVPFCLKASEAGVDIFMDPTIKCGHMTTQVIDHRFHFRYLESIQESKKMGPVIDVKPEPAAV